MKFTETMPVLQALRSHTRAMEVFLKHGLGCARCLGAMAETIEAAARMHQVELGALLRDLNSLVEEESRG